MKCGFPEPITTAEVGPIKDAKGYFCPQYVSPEFRKFESCVEQRKADVKSRLSAQIITELDLRKPRRAKRGDSRASLLKKARIVRSIEE